MYVMNDVQISTQFYELFVSHYPKSLQGRVKSGVVSVI